MAPNGMEEEWSLLVCRARRTNGYSSREIIAETHFLPLLIRFVQTSLYLGYATCHVFIFVVSFLHLNAGSSSANYDAIDLGWFL